MNKQNRRAKISELEEGQIIRFPVTQRTSTLASMKGQKTTLGYISAINLDEYDRILNIEVLEILPLNADPRMQAKLHKMQFEDVAFEKFNGDNFGLSGRHVVNHSKSKNEWAMIGIPKKLCLDDFADGGNYNRTSIVHDEGSKSKIQALVNRAEAHRNGQKGSGYAMPRSEHVWTGGAFNKGGPTPVDGRQWDNLPDDVIERQAKPKKVKEGQEAKTLDLPLVFASAALDIPEEFLALFMQPKNQKRNTIKTLQQLYQLSENDAEFAAYFPNEQPTLKQVLDMVVDKEDPDEYPLYLNAKNCFDCDPDIMEPITEWSDLIGFIKETKDSKDPLTRQQLDDYIEGLEGIPDFLLQMDERYKQQSAAAILNPLDGKNIIQKARRQFLKDMVDNNTASYRHDGDDAVTVDLITKDGRMGAKQRAVIEKNGGRSVTFNKGDTTVIKLTTLHYRFM